MTKASAIMIRPVVPLQRLPDQDRDVLRRVLFENIQGLDAVHHRRWLRFWRRLFESGIDEVTTFYNEVERSRKFHARWMAIERRLFENQDAYVHLERFRDWLKTGAGFGTYQIVGERMKFVPSSLKYEQCADDEMREFAEAAVAFLRTARALRKLWRHLPAARRQEMLETLLADPNKQGA